MNNLALLYIMCSVGRDHVAKCSLSIDRVWVASEPQGPRKHFPTIFGLTLGTLGILYSFPAQSPSEISKNSASKRRSLS